MSDERMQELWVMGMATQRKSAPVHVHIFPARDIDALMRSEDRAQHRRFWENVKAGFDSFEADRKRMTT